MTMPSDIKHAKHPSALNAALRLAAPGTPAPAWRTSTWLNTPTGLSLEGLRGSVVALHAFQMLCPGCVQHGLPQAQRLDALFRAHGLVTVGLHTVFEHHAAMSPVSLAAFVHEYRLTFPIGVDEAGEPGGDGVPRTMRALELRGTPSLLLIDREGDLRWHAFGAVDDMVAAAAVTALLLENASGR